MDIEERMLLYTEMYEYYIVTLSSIHCYSFPVCQKVLCQCVSRLHWLLCILSPVYAGTVLLYYCVSALAVVSVSLFTVLVQSYSVLCFKITSFGHCVTVSVVYWYKITMN